MRWWDRVLNRQDPNVVAQEQRKQEELEEVKRRSDAVLADAKRVIRSAAVAKDRVSEEFARTQRAMKAR
jgi:hypothetical protein